MIQPDDGDLVLKVRGYAIGGWQSVEVTRGVEQMPSTFQVGMTERDASGRTVVVTPGDPCEVWIGGDRVVAGYVDSVASASAPDQAGLTIAGRGKCQDLVDCSAEWPNAQISGDDVFGIAKKLAAPYGITVRCSATLAAPQPAFNVTLTETPYNLIEEMARHYQCLVYEDTDGALLLAPVGTQRHASGLAEPGNVEAATVTRSVAERFSDYFCYLVSTNMLGDLGDLGPAATAADPNVRRHRRRAMVAEQGSGGSDLPARRAAWECSRRRGRGEVAVLTVDSWRDAAGRLWTPNMLAPLHLPRHRLTGVAWLIAEVAYRRDENGTRAQLVLMPAEAFSPEPILLQPLFPDIVGPE